MSITSYATKPNYLIYAKEELWQGTMKNLGR